MSPGKTSLIAVLLLTTMLVGCGGQKESGKTPAPSPRRSQSSPSPTTSTAPSPAPFKGKLIRLTVEKGKVTPNERSVEVKIGELVRIEVSADVVDEIHVHAYDKKQPVRPGETSALEFTADIPGSFEVELEKSGTDLFELSVK